MSPAVTTVIPTFRRPRLLERAIRSVLNQNFTDLIVAVFDNASGDETEAVVSQLASQDSRVRYHCHASNLGTTANFDFGVSSVTTPFFSVLSDDDVLLPDFYAEAVHELSRHPKAEFFCGRTLVDDQIIGVLARRNRGWTAGVYSPSSLTARRMLQNHFVSTGVVFRSSIREDMGPFSSFLHDRDLAAWAAGKYSFVVSEQDHAIVTVHQDCFSGGSELIDNGVVPRLMSVGFAVEAGHAAAAKLRELDTLTEKERESVILTLRRVARDHAMYLYLFWSLPAGRVGEVKTLIANSTFLDFPMWLRELLKIWERMERIAIFRVLSIRTARMGVRLFRKIKRLRSGYDEDDAPFLEYLGSDCTAPEILAERQARGT